MPKNRDEILKTIAFLESRLHKINSERELIINDINSLKHSLSEGAISFPKLPPQFSLINVQLPISKKIALFRSLFRGRDDVFPKLWLSKKTGKTGYSPVCKNEWVRGLCEKGSIKCGECKNRKFPPLTDEVIHKHLKGDITIGIYPMLEDETCCFLAVDFDKQNWQDDSGAFLAACKKNNVPASLERSRSGNGGHVWIFFSEPVSAALARQMGSYLITETMSGRHELDMKSYDRLFPNQDTLPKGGFGNLIALPLQKGPMTEGNSVFIDEGFIPYADQWNYMSNIIKMSLKEVRVLVADAVRSKDIMGVFILQALEEKRSPIVLTERKEHLEILKQKLQNFVKHIIILHGGMRAKTRKEMVAKLADIPDTEERLILATGQYIGEGFDDPRLDTLFLAMPFSFKGKMVQYAGRLHRLYPGKTDTRIYDYADENISVLSKMYKRRLNAYRSLGYEEVNPF